MPRMRLSQSQMDQVLRMTKCVTRDEKTGECIRWKGVVEACQALGVSRTTVWTALKLHEKEKLKPRALEPKYVEEFESSPIVVDFKQKYKGKLKNFGAYLSVGRNAWLHLNKKDPESWDEQDYLKLWNWEGFRDETTGQIEFNDAVRLRKWMVHCKRFDLPKRDEFTTKGLKKPKGAKKTHYIKTLDDMGRFINVIRYPDTLNLFEIGSQCGARFSSLKEIKPQDIDYSQNAINMYEPKVRKYVIRKFNPCTLESLKKFIVDFDIKGDQRVFKRSIIEYNREFREAGKIVGIDFKVTTHTAMKHTFVSQASAHDVSLEVVSEQCGTDPQTIREFYLGGLSKKMDAELLGVKEVKETWKEYIEKLHPFYVERYGQIKGAMTRVNGIVKTEKMKPIKKKAPAKKREFSWDRIEALTKIPEPKTEKGKRLWLYWRKVWKVHEEHPRLTFAEIKERLKK